MKRRDVDGSDRPAQDPHTLAEVLAQLADPREIEAFLIDLCTPAEIEALADRWTVVPLLDAGLSYRAIHERTGVSVTTVGRIARCLEQGAGGYRAALRADAARRHAPTDPGAAPTRRHPASASG